MGLQMNSPGWGKHTGLENSHDLYIDCMDLDSWILNFDWILLNGFGFGLGFNFSNGFGHGFGFYFQWIWIWTWI